MRSRAADGYASSIACAALEPTMRWCESTPRNPPRRKADNTSLYGCLTPDGLCCRHDSSPWSRAAIAVSRSVAWALWRGCQPSSLCAFVVSATMVLRIAFTHARSWGRKRWSRSTAAAATGTARRGIGSGRHPNAWATSLS